MQRRQHQLRDKSNLTQFGRSHPEICRNEADLSRISHEASDWLCRKHTQCCGTLPNIGQLWSKPTQIWSNPAEVGRTELTFGGHRPQFCRNRPSFRA